MAIDTPAKRFSMLNFGSPTVNPLIIPDGTIDAGDRYHFLGLYSGIALAESLLWTVQTPVSTSWADQSADTTIWTDETPDSTVWTDQ